MLPTLSFAALISGAGLAQQAEPATAVEEAVTEEAAAEEAAAEEPAVEEPPPSAAEAALAASAALYPRRDNSAKAQEAITMLEAALAEEPDNFELLIQLARFYYWTADTAGSDSLKSSRGKTCWDYAERAKQINSSVVEGHYWVMACVGAYSEGVGILKAVSQGLADKFKTHGEKAVSIDANHDSGGPLRGMGRYYFALPWPLRDLDNSRSYLERALAVDGTHGRNLYYLADLERDEGNEDQARAYLERILALTPSGDKGPDARLYKPLAQEMLADLD